ncbi:pyridoxamine 5'-phosphate oxidase family protein [Mesorhizobium sp. A556]
MIVREMTAQENTSVVSAGRMVRLACAMDGQPYVVPIYYALAYRHLYSFSMPGQKVEWMRANPKVCVQVDDLSSARNWKSIVIYGVFDKLADRIGTKVERERAWSLLEKHANWWEPGGLNLLDEGDSIDLGDRQFRVLHLPSHSLDSIALFDEKDGTFISGDAIYDDTLLDDLPDSDRTAYRRTMQRLLDLPIRIGHGGHGPSFSRQRMIEIATDYLRHADQNG